VKPTEAAALDLVEHDSPNTIQRYVWERYFRDGSKYIRVHHARTLGEVYADLAARVYALDNDDESVEWVSFAAKFAFSSHHVASAQLFPDYGREPGSLVRVACYAETGGSEGELTRIDIVTVHSDCEKARCGIHEVLPFACIKTFFGMDHASKLARLCIGWFEQ